MQVCQAARYSQRKVAPVLVPARLAGHLAVIADACAQVSALHQLRDQEHLETYTESVRIALEEVEYRSSVCLG